MRLLVVEDDVELARGLVSSLAQSGYEADVAHNAHDAIAACAATNYALVILDLGLPDQDGLELLRRLRLESLKAPVLILTARDQPQQRVAGLDGGGDDYLSKPFDVAELEARIRALLRRGEPLGATLNFGALAFETASRHLTARGREVELTPSELAVLELLLRRPGRIVSKAQIFNSLYRWQENANMSAVEVFISRLRRKLTLADADVGIRVFRGLGYRLEKADHASA
jgi:DNA-binding response OmpR family regulator